MAKKEKQSVALGKDFKGLKGFDGNG